MWHDDHSHRFQCMAIGQYAVTIGVKLCISRLVVAILLDGASSAHSCRSFAAKGLLPAWYMALRLPLTLAAVSGMAITLVGSSHGADIPAPTADASDLAVR